MIPANLLNYSCIFPYCLEGEPKHDMEFQVRRFPKIRNLQHKGSEAPLNRVVISTTSFGRVDRRPLELLEDFGAEYELNPYGRKPTAAEMIELLKDVDGLIAGTEGLNRDVLSLESEQSSWPEAQPVLCRTRMINEYPLIPDMERLETMLAALPG